jgi:hypothetical protein
MRLASLVAIVVLLSGCSGSEAPSPATADRDGDGFVDAVEERFGSDAGDNASVPDVARSQAVDFSDTVQVVGTGVPTVQCPADIANSQVLTWTVTADTGASNRTWVSDLSFSIQGAATVNDVDLFVTGPSGDVGSATGSTNAETVTASGPRPLGDYSIEVRGCSGAGDVEVTASGVVHWIPDTDELLADA